MSSSVRMIPRCCEENEVAVVLTFDDFFLRNEWNKGVATISNTVLPADSDFLILEILKEFGVRGTFFITGIVAEKFPQKIRECANQEFEIAGHGFFHEDFTKIEPHHQTYLINKTLKTLSKVCGSSVEGWRNPGLFFNRKVRASICKSLIKWCSNIRLPSIFRQYPFEYYSCSKMEIPISTLFNDFDMYKTRNYSCKKVLRYWQKNFERVQRRRKSEIFTLVFHPWVQVQNKERIKTFRQFIDDLASNEKVVFKKCGEIYDDFPKIGISNFRQSLSRWQSALINFGVSVYRVSKGKLH